MYLSHFGLNEPPFTITPVTEFFFEGANRGATVEALIYAISHGEGIIKVAGEVGSGKTMLCRVLIERLPPSVETIYLANPSLSRDDLLFAIADEIHLDLAGQHAHVAVRSLQMALIEKYAAGKRVVALIDEAHAMPVETLEQLRLLYNLESSRHKLMQIVLFGQPELDENLNLPQMRQLKERIVHHFTMQPLTMPVIKDYLMFRMRAAGYRGPEIFSAGAIRLIARVSRGLTRRVNIVADKALLAAFVDNTHGIEPKHVKAAIRDCEFDDRPRPVDPRLIGTVALAAGFVVGIGWHMLGPALLAPAVQFQTVAAPPAAKISMPASNAPVAAPAPRLPATGASGPSISQGPQAQAAPVPAPENVRKPAEEPRPAAERQRAEPSDLATVNVAGFELLGQRIEAARTVLGSAAEGNLSIQLFLTDDVRPARMERFLQRASRLVNLADIYVYPTRMGGHLKYRVMYGLYASREEASAAMAGLPQKYKTAFKPDLRYVNDMGKAG